MFGKNIDNNKVKMIVRIRMKFLFAHVVENFYITIWSCMKLENVFEFLPMLILDMFMDRFVFIWGCKQATRP